MYFYQEKQPFWHPSISAVCLIQDPPSSVHQSSIHLSTALSTDRSLSCPTFLYFKQRDVKIFSSKRKTELRANVKTFMMTQTLQSQLFSFFKIEILLSVQTCDLQGVNKKRESAWTPVCCQSLLPPLLSSYP